MGRLAVAGLAAALFAPAACTRPAAFAVDGARAHARVVRQVEAGPRIPGTPGHAATVDWIESELRRLGGVVRRQSFTDTTLGRPLALTNLIGRFEPAAAVAGQPAILLCAHFDSRPWADRDPDPARHADPVPGANDGGSGVAVLLEIAELFHRQPPPGVVELVFFDGEDLGRRDSPEGYSLGARGYAARLTPPLPRAAFLFDMVGDRDLGIYPELNGFEQATSLARLVLEAARATGARHFHETPRHRVVDDHVPLLERGIPAVNIIDFDYPAWHTIADLPDQVSPESLAEVARVAAWLVYRSPLARAR